MTRKFQGSSIAVIRGDLSNFQIQKMNAIFWSEKFLSPHYCKNYFSYKLFLINWPIWLDWRVHFYRDFFNVTISDKWKDLQVSPTLLSKKKSLLTNPHWPRNVREQYCRRCDSNSHKFSWLFLIIRKQKGLLLKIPIALPTELLGKLCQMNKILRYPTLL